MDEDNVAGQDALNEVDCDIVALPIFVDAAREVALEPQDVHLDRFVGAVAGVGHSITLQPVWKDGEVFRNRYGCVKDVAAPHKRRVSFGQAAVAAARAASAAAA
jgi:hypothetical protein